MAYNSKSSLGFRGLNVGVLRSRRPEVLVATHVSDGLGTLDTFAAGDVRVSPILLHCCPAVLDKQASRHTALG
jgi:hypothetical protein